MSRNRTLRLLAMVFSVGSLLLVTTSKSHAIDFQTGQITLSVSVDYSNGSWKFLIDPVSVEEFQLSVEFDQDRARFEPADTRFLNGYVQKPGELITTRTGSNGLSILLNVHGIIGSGLNPQPVELDVVELTFIDLMPSLDPNTMIFRVFASENDFVNVVDPVGTFIGPGQIKEVISPEPSTLLLGSFALLGFLGYVWRRRTGVAK